MFASGRQQAKLYADALERMTGQRPVIFLSNGYEHWIWDDLRYPPREIGGFLQTRRTGACGPAADEPQDARRDQA